MATTVHRTARIRVQATPAQARRCLGLMSAAGDVWAMVLDCNAQLRRWGQRQVVDLPSLCRELTGMSFGELARICQEDVLKRYSAAWISAARRRKAGDEVGFPRRKRRYLPVRFRHGSFELADRRLRLAVGRGAPPLWLRLRRGPPYPEGSLRAVTLVWDCGRLYVDVTAALAVTEAPGDRVAGVDVGIIHPFALACGDEALVVSGRALRAEERLHLDDTKRRHQKMAPKTPGKGRRGSRRWRKLRRTQRRAEARHRRRIRHGHHEAAGAAIAWARARGVGTLVVGDPHGITTTDCGPTHNLRLRQWRRSHLVDCLTDKAERAGITVIKIDERGTSSTCPQCRARVTKPRGRRFSCPGCGHTGHRDVVGARNIAARGGGHTSAPVLITHRRAGHPPARRDRRRHLYDARRSCPAPGHPQGCRSLEATPARIADAV